MLGPEESLYRSSCEVGDLNLFTSSFVHEPIDVEVKVRYATPATRATVSPLTPSTLRIQFHTPQRALSPGQSAVFYRDDEIFGGGIIQAF